MNNKYHSEAMKVLHDDMKGMHQLEIINDEQMREFDEMCLAEKPDPEYLVQSKEVGSG